MKGAIHHLHLESQVALSRQEFEDRAIQFLTAIRPMGGDIMETTIATEISFALWLARQARKMTQSQVAMEMGTSRQQVSEIEIGQLPTVATLARIAQALQVSPAHLVLIAESRRRVSVRPHSEPY